jgi:hypothetical protein
MNLPNRFGIKPSATIWKIIARYASNSCIFKLHSFDGFSNASWLIAIKIDWLSSVNLTKITSPSALVSAN